MPVRVLECWAYDADGRRREPERVANPSWEQIEAAIRRMNSKTRPILFLWPTEDQTEHMLDEFCERFEVMGENGVYWVAGTFEGYFQRRLHDPAAGSAEVELYGPLIEQGFASAARHICHDVEKVLRAARHYHEHGEFDPAMNWEPGRRTV